MWYVKLTLRNHKIWILSHKDLNKNNGSSIQPYTKCRQHSWALQQLKTCKTAKMMCQCIIQNGNLSIIRQTLKMYNLSGKEKA